MLQRASLVLVMSEAHLRALQPMISETPVSLLAEYAEGVREEVPDPFGGDLEAYRRSFQLLRRWVASGLGRFQRGFESERI
jgi:protein-tyrosine-phosphatase